MMVAGTFQSTSPKTWWGTSSASSLPHVRSVATSPERKRKAGVNKDGCETSRQIGQQPGFCRGQVCRYIGAESAPGRGPGAWQESNRSVDAVAFYAQGGG